MFKPFVILAALVGVIGVAPTAHAASNPDAASAVPGCEASFETRFDAATKLVFDQSPKSRPATADKRLREVWRATPLCEGETYFLGSNLTPVSGPKAFGVAIPDSATDIVGKTAPLVRNLVTGSTEKQRLRNLKKAYPNGSGDSSRSKRLARGTFHDCTVTAWSPTYSYAYTVRGGAEVTCGSTHDLYVYPDLQRWNGSNFANVASATGNNYGTYVTKVTAYVSCYDAYSYRTYTSGSSPDPYWAYATDTTSTFASPDAYCY